MDIEIINISKRFKDTEVLQRLNMRIIKGRINCIMGESGVGKTTLLNIILGLVKEDFGKITGIEDKKISAVFQEDRLIEHLDAIDNIRLVCDKTVTVKDIEKEFEKVGLKDYHNKSAKNLSGGMRRRVAIVRAILATSDIIIMDEPFKGLDDMLKTQVIEYVKMSTKNKTVIIVTHEMNEVKKLEANLIHLS